METGASCSDKERRAAVASNVWLANRFTGPAGDGAETK